ncbi:MAG: single-stranded-DNA-specific exonuclease RecJ, partial [Alphaproteobacteria bacterium]
MRDGVVFSLPDGSQSFTGRRWVWRSGASQDAAAVERMAAAIAQVHGVPDVAARLLAARGQDVDSAATFLEPRLRDLLPDPSGLQDMDAAADRIAAAVRRGEPIAIFGDYDVDGATASALLCRHLIAVGATVSVYIPDRLAEGYGPNAPALRGLRAAGAALCITVDCGITAFEALAAAAGCGLEMIVVDHHQAEPALPVAVAVVNPNRLDDRSGQGVLAAVGVAFLLAVAVNRALRRAGHFAARAEPDLIGLLDLVAVGTVCDVVPLTGLNRALVAQGLRVLARGENVGLAALAEVAGLDAVASAYHLGFVIGPRINAGGRVGTPDLGARLLRTDDPAEARDLARRLHALNEERRALEADTLADAIARVDRGEGVDDGLILLADTGWHPGVVGIVAARLKDRYHRPAFVGGSDGAVVKASGRSIAGVDLGAAVIAARQAGLLVNGGGHAMAAGLTVAVDRLAAAHAFLAGRIGAQTGHQPIAPTLSIDDALSLRGAGLPVIDAVDRLEPFGSANPRPRFGWFNVMLVHAEPVGEGGHLRCRLADSTGGQAKAMAFRALQGPLGDGLLGARDRVIHIAGTLRRDRWRGTETALLTIDDAA